jgi:hypothetical protein
MSGAGGSDPLWCERVVGELRRHHDAVLDDDGGARGWLDAIGEALAGGLAEWGCDLGDPRQRGAVAAAALVLHQCATLDDQEATEEVAARLACLLASLTHAVVHRLDGDLAGLAAAVPPDVPCGDGGTPGGSGAATGQPVSPTPTGEE